MLTRGFQFAPGYRLQEFLGRGQFGQVWRASAPGGAAAAVKFIDLSDGQGQKEYDAVRRVKQIRHANLMPITAIWLLDAQGQVIEEAPDEALETIDLSVPEAPGQSAVYPPEVAAHWLVVAMLLGGKSLHHRLQECLDEGLAGIPAKELIAYMDESAKGLDFLNKPQHDLGDGPIAIQHSDVKPANIVLIGSSAVVCDFGLARILSRNQVTATSPSGTPAYMAPEAIKGKPSRTSDQYSLAVTYYHLRTGRLPVNDGSVWEVLDAHRTGKLNLGAVSKPEQVVLRKATDLNWENRFPSILDFVDALREALRAEGTTLPSFVPLAAETAKLTSEPTAPVQFDPTETVDSLAGETRPNDALAATAQSIPVDRVRAHDTVINETLPSVGAAIDSVAGDTGDGLGKSGTGSFIIRIQQHPIITAVISAGLLSLIALLVFINGSGASSESEGADASGGDISEGLEQVNPVPLTDSETQIAKSGPELLAEAIALVDRDFDAASSLYQQAIEQTPDLAPEPTRLTGMGSGPIRQMDITPDGRWLVSIADGPTPFLRKLADLQSPVIPLPGHERLLNAYAIDSSGTRLLTGGFDSEARVWNLRSSVPAQSPLLLSGLQGSIEAVAWSPQQPIVYAASSAMQLGMWQLTSSDADADTVSIQRQRQLDIGKLITDLQGDPKATWLAALSIGSDLLAPDPDVLIYRCDDLWNAEGSPEPISLNAKQAKQIAFLQGQTEPTLAIGEVGGSVALYAIGDENKLIQRLEPGEFNNANHIDALVTVASQTGDVILAGSSLGTMLWWRYADANEHKRWNFGNSEVTDIDLSTDGRWAAAGTGNGSVWLCDTAADEGKGAIQLVANSGAVDSIRLDPTGNWMIAGCDDGTIEVWDLRHLKLMTSVAKTKEIRLDDDPAPEVEEEGKLTSR